MTPEMALAALQDDPLDFLKENFLIIAGSTAASGVVDTYHIGHKDFPPPAIGAPRFRIQATTMGQPGAEKKFSAHSVKMIPSATFMTAAGGLDRIPGYDLDNAGPPIMVTGQLTACTFAIAKAGTGLTCAHLQPGAVMVPTPAMGLPPSPAARPLSGLELNTAILTAGRFTDGTKVTVAFGPKFYPSQNVTIVGVRKNGQWSVFAQLTNGVTPTGAVKVL